MHRIARYLITVVALMTLIGSNLADWNTTHNFSELWSMHARFHGAWFDFAVSLLSILSLWLAWLAPEQPQMSRIAALIQGAIWLAFFPPMLVPGTALADPGRAIAPIAGIELNFYGAVANLVLLGVALALLRVPRGQAAAAAERPHARA
jgi:hypothetical protein